LEQQDQKRWWNKRLLPLPEREWQRSLVLNKIGNATPQHYLRVFDEGFDISTHARNRGSVPRTARHNINGTIVQRQDRYWQWWARRDSNLQPKDYGLLRLD